MLALQDKDSLLKYLANVPVKLMPQVMAFPLGQDTYALYHIELSRKIFDCIVFNNAMVEYAYALLLPYCVKSDAKTKRKRC